MSRKPKVYFRHCDVAQPFDESCVISELTKKPKYLRVVHRGKVIQAEPELEIEDANRKKEKTDEKLIIEP